MQNENIKKNQKNTLENYLTKVKKAFVELYF